MARLLSKARTEDEVLDYLVENTSKSFDKFNPVKLSKSAISKNLDIIEEDVDEALTDLSQDSARVEEVDASFKLWLPLNEEGEKIKEKLFRSELAYTNVWLFSFFIIILLFYITKWVVANNWLILESNADFFFAGVAITAISVKIAKIVANRAYLFNQEMQKIQFYKIYVWMFMVATTLFIYSFNQGFQNNPPVQAVVFFTSMAANIITIALFIKDLAREVKNAKNPRKK